jgi:Tfp pilus assembly PilM family ATPase
LVKSDEISSTEKLLDLIRKRGKAPAKPSEGESPSPRRKTRRKRPVKRSASKIPVTIGVDIHANGIWLAASATGADGVPELLNFQNEVLETPLAIDTPEFSNFLGKTLSGFTAQYRKFDVWVSMPSANVEMRLLKLPKIPDRQVPNAAKWAFRREASLDEVRDIFDFHPLGLTFDDGVQKIPLLAYTVPREEVKQLQTVFQKSGFSLTGVSIVPFAIQNLLKAEWLETENKNVCSLFVGKDWSRIAIYADGNLMLGRDIKAGVHSIVEAIAENMRSASVDGMEAVGNLKIEMPENPSLSGETAAEDLLLAFLRDQLPHDPQADHPLGAAQIAEIIAAPLERIIRQVAMTIEHYSSNYDKRGISKVLISGDIAGHPWIAHRISRHLDLPAEVMDPFIQAPTPGTAITVPEAIFSKMAYLPSMGMALSDNATTPNFLFTHDQKSKVKMTKRFNRIAYSVFGLLFTVLVVVFAWQTKAIITVRNEVLPMRKELERFSPKLDRALVSKFTGDLVGRMKAYSSSTQRYIGAAVLTDVINRTPQNVSLSNMTIDLGEVSTTAINTGGRFVLINGFVATERNALETTLANYIAALRSSPLLGQPEMKRQSLESMNEQTVMQFTVTVPIN